MKFKQYLRNAWPFAYYCWRYHRTAQSFKSSAGSRNDHFKAFLDATHGPCLQIAVKDEIGEKFGQNWISVDKYDMSDYIDRHDDVESLEFSDETFNAVVCWSVLEHVPNPQKAVSELYRVLKPGGLVWVQLPFLYPNHAEVDYWRVTPMGLRQWMLAFDETVCACDYWSSTNLVAATYFSGKKPN